MTGSLLLICVVLTLDEYCWNFSGSRARCRRIHAEPHDAASVSTHPAPARAPLKALKTAQASFSCETSEGLTEAKNKVQDTTGRLYRQRAEGH